MIVPLYGCKDGIKAFVKNRTGSSGIYDEADSSDEDDFFSDTGGSNNEDGAGYRNNTSSVNRDSVSKTSYNTKGFGRRRRSVIESEKSTAVTHSQNISLTNDTENRNRNLKKDNNGPQLANKTKSVIINKHPDSTARSNPLNASGRSNNGSASVENKIKGLVTQIAMAVPATEKLKISIVEFSNFHGETTDFTTYLYEELVTLFSSNPKFEVVGSTSKIGKKSAKIDAIVTGSVMGLEDNVKVNARLMLKRTGMIVTAVSTSLPKDKAIERLMEKKHKAISVKSEGDDLYSKIDDLAGQIVNCLQQGRKYKLVLLEFTDMNGKTSTFSKFLFQELVTRLFLANNKKIEIVDNNIINEFIKEHHISLQELPYPESSKKLAESLGVNCIVKGVITDLGNSIKLNTRVITAETGSMFGVAAVDIEKDEKLAKLLSEKHKVASFDTGKIETKIDVDIKEEHASLGAADYGTVFFEEDFTNYDDGQPLQVWGEGLVVRKDESDKYFLTSDVDDFSVASRDIQFPDEFSFEFEVKGSTKYWSSIRFKDSDGSVFSVSFRLFQDVLSITFPGPKQVKTEIDVNNYCKIKIVRKNKLYELHTNDSLLIVGSYSKYKTFNSFEIHSAFNRFQFAGFVANNLVEN
ncbi:membrane-fusion protein [Candidatus Scalindua japonica]|uniref:Membrane-fusion protein n=2 Tax=Candidatus Scalindua japonica TaxID=1284222 RepID=A0A286U419_9BACT|nr:membrane-fusion protein [Candidatus Scalindua japonica]